MNNRFYNDSEIIRVFEGFDENTRNALFDNLSRMEQDRLLNMYGCIKYMYNEESVPSNRAAAIEVGINERTITRWLEKGDDAMLHCEDNDLAYIESDNYLYIDFTRLYRYAKSQHEKGAYASLKKAGDGVYDVDEDGNLRAVTQPNYKATMARLKQIDSKEYSEKQDVNINHGLVNGEGQTLGVIAMPILPGETPEILEEKLKLSQDNLKKDIESKK